MSGRNGARQRRYALPPGATQLLLVRHGESVAAEAAAAGDVRPFWGRQADPPLHECGREEAIRVADRLRHEAVDAIYTSPLTRTRQTAAPLADALALEPVVDDDLREVFLGAVDGMNLGTLAPGDEAVRRALREQRWELLPGAERQAEFAARVRGAIERIAAAHPGGAVAVFAHAGVIGQVLADATGSAALHAFVGCDNGSISHLVVTDDRWTVRAFNDTGHLRASLLAGPQPLVANAVPRDQASSKHLPRPRLRPTAPRS